MSNERATPRPGLVSAWLDDLRRAFGEAPINVSDVRIGVFYTAVELDAGEVGVAFTPREHGAKVCCPRAAAAAPNAGHLAGESAWSLAAYALSPVPLRRAVGVATLNALSALAFEGLGPDTAVVLRGVDGLQAAGVGSADRVVLVGSFLPFVRALRHRVSSLAVIDRHREGLGEEHAALWTPPERGDEVISQASVVILTGSSLVEGGIERLLDAAASARMTVIAGPTTPLWAPPFFARGVDVLAGIRVTDGARMLRLVSEGGSGAFFTAAAEKICLVPEERTEACVCGEADEMEAT
jgi:uncharacterized protein (DUF4213/DUF364 family)